MSRKPKLFSTTLYFVGEGDFKRRDYRAYVLANTKAEAAKAFGYGISSFDKYASVGGPEAAEMPALLYKGKVVYERNGEWLVKP